MRLKFSSFLFWQAPILFHILLLFDCMQSYFFPKNVNVYHRAASIVFHSKEMMPFASPLLRPALEAEIFTFANINDSTAKIEYKISLKSDVTRFYYQPPTNPSLPTPTVAVAEAEEALSTKKNEKITVDLITTVHIGEPQYYQHLQQELKNYDLVLYELITTKENILINPSFPYQKQLFQPLYSKTTESVAQQFQWKTQMMLPMMTANWFIADLEASIIAQLELFNSPNIYWKYLWSIFAGRSFSNRFLINFMISDSWFVSFLRILTWLTPCPEINSLLIDWARMWPRAGGISPFLLPILNKLSKFQFLNASRLAFTQQMLSGLADSGSWGGEAKSDIAVRIFARNQECCSVLLSFLSDLTQNRIPSLANKSNVKIAVLYGAYHIEDLKKRFVEDLQLTVDQSYQQSFNAWTVASADLDNLPVHGDSHDQNVIPWVKGKQDLLLKLLDFPTIAILSFSTLLYVALGVFDWWVAVELIVKDFEKVLFNSEEFSEKILFSSFIVAYALLYVQRHLFCLRKISYVGIQWNRGLFADL